MALPNGNEQYGNYTDQLVYFGARLAADPKTAEIASSVDAILDGVDESHERLREARRDEVRARALRDHKDDIGDTKVRRYRRQVKVIENVGFVDERLFSRGLAFLTAPRGRAQIERLTSLRATTQDLLASEQVALHPEGAELRETLEGCAAMIGAAAEELELAVSEWEAQAMELARARDLFRFRRSNGVAQLGAVLGELRALLNGSARAAYSYTASARRRAVEVEVEDEAEEEEEEVELGTLG